MELLQSSRLPRDNPSVSEWLSGSGSVYTRCGNGISFRILRAVFDAAPRIGSCGMIVGH